MSPGIVVPGHRRLVVQQPLLHPQAAAVADEAAVGSDDPVTGDHYRERVLVVRHAHGPARLRIADPGRDRAVALGLRKTDVLKRPPDFQLEVGPFRRERQIELGQLSGEVRLELFETLLKCRVGRPGSRSGVLSRERAREVQLAKAPLVGDEKYLADRRLETGPVDASPASVIPGSPACSVLGLMRLCPFWPPSGGRSCRVRA